MTTTTIELVTYRLKAGIEKAQFAATHEAVNTFLTAQPGFIYRSNSEDKDGLIYDIVYWQSMEQALTAGEAFMQHPAGQSLIAVTEENSITMRHMPADTEAMGNCANAA